MTEHDDNDRGSGFRRMIFEAKEEAYHARRKLRRELPNPGPQTKIQVAAALSDYRDLLSDYHDEHALKTSWDERDVNVDAIDTAIAETTTVEKPMNRRGGATETTTLPKAAAMPAGELIKIGKELDAIAKELGFAARVNDPTPNTDASHDDLAGLLKARGQDQALENFPDSWVPEEDQTAVPDGGEDEAGVDE